MYPNACGPVKREKALIFYCERNEKRTGGKKRTSTDLHPVMLTPLVRSSRAIPQLIAKKPGDWRDSMRHTKRRIISWVSAAGVALESTSSSVVL